MRLRLDRLEADLQVLLDFEEDEEDENGGTPSPQPAPGGRGKRKPWRYRWPDEFRDEVLARLLELNEKRSEEEALSGAAAEKPAGGSKVSPKPTGRRKKVTKGPRLPGVD